jgi:serine protease Do
MRKKIVSLIVLILALVTLSACLDTRAQLPYESPHPIEEMKINMIAEVEPSVVAVRTETGHGSGIIFKSEDIGEGAKRYWIMTNYHVIEDGGEMNVYFGPEQEAINVKDVAGFKLYDIAVVRIETTRQLRVHSSAVIDDDTKVEIVKGQYVFAIGTPQDIDKFNYVTMGIVSLPTYSYNGVVDLGIMHNAELNPGNSGGPLFNLNGELIGINVAKVASVSTSEGSIAAEGLNYSLNINRLGPIIRAFNESDFQAVVRRPRLGITVQEVAVFLEENDPSLLPPDPVGVVVIGLDESRNALGQIEEYDLVIEMNGTPITSIADIAQQLQDANFGDEHVLKVLRKVDGEFVELTFTIILS